MNPSEQQKREIDELVHEVPASTIPLHKQPPTSLQTVNLVEQGKTLWNQESRELFADYEFGLSLGKFGNNDLSTNKFLKRLQEAITSTITHACNRENISSENFQLHFNIINSILTLIAREIENKKLAEYNVKTLIAVLHGFFESYINETITRKQRKGITE